LLADDASRAEILASGDRVLVEEVQAAITNPRVRERVNDLAARARAEAELRRSSLLLPQRRMVEQIEESDGLAAMREAYLPAARVIIQWAGERDRSRGERSSPFGAWDTAIFGWFALLGAGIVLLAVMFRGGISFTFAGITLVRTDGRRAARWRCGLRALLVWLPMTGLLFGSALVQLYAPARPYLAAGLFLAAVALLPVYVVIALRFPTRPPQDRLLGTHLVPL
jgi:hypothetical protein